MDTPLTPTVFAALVNAALLQAQQDAARWCHLTHQLLYTPKSRCRLRGGPPEAHTAACGYRQAVEAPHDV